MAAARALDVGVVVASEEPPTLAETMGDRALTLPLHDPEAATARIEALHARTPLDAVIALDDQGVVVAAVAGERLGFPHNPPEAARRTRDKEAMRNALAASEVSQPRYAAFDDPGRPPDIGYPCVVKPVGLAASRGVIRADDRISTVAAAARVAAIADGGRLLVEEYIPGHEVAVEALLVDAELQVLAVFDKPDPLEGPFFEETIYVTPSRLDSATLRVVERATADAARALGLREGPVHAELRVHAGRAWVIEVAARSIGGLCARTLRFGAGISLEEVILRHALGRPLGHLGPEGRAGQPASGVMMLPIPRAGVFGGIHGQDEARAVPGIEGLEVTVPRGRVIQPLPEGDRYLGFLFARAATPHDVESALRVAFTRLTIEIDAPQAHHEA